MTLAGCGAKPDAGGSRTVVIYVSEDQVFSEPILKNFEKETGIQVKAVFDTEESKSTGVMNRLLAEKNNPQADVYWANEPVRADVRTGHATAEVLQTRCAWTVINVPDVGHDGERMSVAAAPVVAAALHVAERG